MLKFSGNNFSIIMTNMLKNLVETVGNMHKLMENFSREMEVIKRNQIEISEIKNLTVDY